MYLLGIVTHNIQIGKIGLTTDFENAADVIKSLEVKLVSELTIGKLKIVELLDPHLPPRQFYQKAMLKELTQRQW